MILSNKWQLYCLPALTRGGQQHSRCHPGSWDQQGRTWGCANSLALIRAEAWHVSKHWLPAGSVNASLGAMISSRWVAWVGRRGDTDCLSDVAKYTRLPSLSKPIVTGGGMIFHLVNFQYPLFYIVKASVFYALSVACSFIGHKGLMLKQEFLGQLSQIN